MTARLYVGTYGKYASGSIAGKWLDLSDYADRDDFLKAAAELHKDEHDPELMYQDFEGFPRSYYNESYVDPKLWDWLALSEDDRELLAVYRDNIRDDAEIDEAREAFSGTYDSEADWAANFLEDTGSLNELPDHLRNYIDYEAYARDAGYNGDMVFVRHDGKIWVFNNF